MLRFREIKVEMIKMLREKYPNTCMITLSMNIPGPRKTNAAIQRAFLQGSHAIRRALGACGQPILYERKLQKRAGFLDFFVVAAEDMALLKRQMTEIEDGSAYGRLFDIDVYGTDGAQVGREVLGLPVRKCFLCARPAKECGRSRAHSVAELETKVYEILRQGS